MAKCRHVEYGEVEFQAVALGYSYEQARLWCDVAAFKGEVRLSGLSFQSSLIGEAARDWWGKGNTVADIEAWVVSAVSAQIFHGEFAGFDAESLVADASYLSFESPSSLKRKGKTIAAL